MRDDEYTPERPFDYSLRVSHRAKHAKLLIRTYGGLEVVVPRRFPKQAVEQLIHKHRDWITRQLEQRPLRNPQPELPEYIYLPVDGSRTDIFYAPDAGYSGRKPGQLLVKHGAYRDRIGQLRRWIRREAWERLPGLLERLSRQTGLDYKKIIIRSQKTRWGSCSSNGTISLNDQLLFVSCKTVEYLMIHELCHRRYLNHSANFWRLVAQHCPDYAVHEAELNRARRVIPEWFMADLYR